MPFLKPEDFPPEVHQSLSELQQIAAKAKSRFDPQLRYATPMEIALSDLLRGPYDCSGHSQRTGLACKGRAVVGGTVCIKHGAQYKHVKEARDRRLQQLAGPALREMHKLAMSKKPSLIKQKAAADILDRAGVGAIAEAKVRHSFHGQMTGNVTVQIGFLTQPLALEAARAEDAPIVEGSVASAGETPSDPAPADAGRPDGGGRDRA